MKHGVKKNLQKLIKIYNTTKKRVILRDIAKKIKLYYNKSWSWLVYRPNFVKSHII